VTVNECVCLENYYPVSITPLVCVSETILAAATSIGTYGSHKLTCTTGVLTSLAKTSLSCSACTESK